MHFGGRRHLDDPLQAIPSRWNPPSGARGGQEHQEKRRQVHLSRWDIVQAWVYAPYDGRGPSTTSQERQNPRHEHPKPNQERLGLREERLGQRGGASSSRWRASKPMKGASRTKLLSPWPSESMQICLCYMKAH